MCGIIGYIGKNVKKNLIEGLERLEYRGYDSAGMVIQYNNNFIVRKTVGSVDNLKENVKDIEFDGVGIAHTRWATHGKISLENCHPHFSFKNEICLVHNGIIENFEKLKEKLVKKGIKFYGETDSEVVAKILGENLSLKKIKKLFSLLEGSFSIVSISKNKKELFFAKYKSPLYIAFKEKSMMVASDPSCFFGKFNKYLTIDDGEYGKISLNGIEVYNQDSQMVEKKVSKIKTKELADDKNKFKYYMLKEINESKSIIDNIIERYKQSQLIFRLKSLNIKNFNRIYLVGCGTAYHAGLVGQMYFKEMLEKDIFVCKASEFIFEKNILDNKSLCFFISQSGETADTITALKFAKNRGAKTIAIVNAEYSTITRIADDFFPICAGLEKAVASTKAYLAQCIIFYILAKSFKNEDFISNLITFKGKLSLGNNSLIKRLASYLSYKDKVFFIGRGIDYITSLEAALKLKEITYIYAFAECSGELKHGTLALIEKEIPVIVVATDKKTFAKVLNNAYEVKARGGKLILITSIAINKEIKDNFDFIIKIRRCDEKFLPIQSIIILQKLAYFTAVKMGLNPDMPRNLAKSVTVE